MVGLVPGDIVLDGAQTSPHKGAQSPQFSAHVCGQTVAHLSYCWALVCTTHHFTQHQNPMLYNAFQSARHPIWGHLHPHGSLDPPDLAASQTASRSVQLFLHSSQQSVHILNNGPPLSPEDCPLRKGDLEPHLIHGSLGSPESTSWTAPQSVQPLLQGSRSWPTDRQTDRQTDRPTDHA